jgi:phage/plasmid-like protein (TIGR03299 family)
MSHLILEHDGMASVRTVPWHKHLTGDKTNVMDKEPETVVEWLEAAKLGWRVIEEPVFRRVLVGMDEAGPVYHYTPVIDVEDTEWKMTLRSDIGGVLVVVTQDYKPVQNIEAFSFLDALLGGDVEFQTAGSIQNGKRVWVLAKVPGHVDLGGSPALRYLFCTNAHDGSQAVTAAFTNVEIVCANTLNYALKGARQSYKFRHTGNLTQKFAEARRVLGMEVSWSESMKQVADQLGLVKVTDKKALKMLENFTPCKIEDGLGTQAKNNREAARDAIMAIFHGEGPAGDTRANTGGTAWGLLRSMGEFADYGRRYTVRTDQMQRSFEDRSLKQEGLELVLASV